MNFSHKFVSLLHSSPGFELSEDAVEIQLQRSDRGADRRCQPPSDQSDAAGLNILVRRVKELTANRQELAAKDKQIAVNQKELAAYQKDEELTAKDEELAAKDEQIAVNQKELTANQEEIALLKAQLQKLQQPKEGVPPV